MERKTSFQRNLCLLLSLLVYTADSICTWPSDFVNSTWVDSEKGDVVFQNTTLTGFAFMVGSTTVMEWECLEFGNDSSYVVMKSTNTFMVFVRSYRAFRCLKIKKITNTSYRYYQTDPIQSTIDFDRVTVKYDPVSLNTSGLCERTSGASGSEYRVLLKAGPESSARITCPYEILADYSYTYSDSDDSVSCDPSADMGRIDMCTNNTQISFQYPGCTSHTVYSNSSTVWCTDVVTVGTDICVTLYNGEQPFPTIDNTNTFLFSCMCIRADGSQASVTPQYCKQNQSTSRVPTDLKGNRVGAVLNLTRVDDNCPPCPPLTSPVQGSVEIVTNGSMTMATYTCDAPNRIAGNETRVCQLNGTWSGRTVSCSCVIPEAPVNGTVMVSSDGLTLTYSCDAGTVLNGTSTRTCQTGSSTWTGTTPSCDVCNYLSRPNNGSFVITGTGLTSVVTYSCDVGFSLIGEVTRTCQADTTWNDSSPMCMECPSLSHPSSGTVAISTDGIVSVASYSCAAGYSLVGVTVSVCIEGLWNSSTPSCLCDHPEDPANGSVQVLANRVTVTYTCDIGFSLSGQRMLTCQNDGSGWDFSFPMCVRCTSLTSPANGSMTLSTNGTVTSVMYLCNVGFRINGSVTSVCSTSGSWSSTAPICMVQASGTGSDSSLLLAVIVLAVVNGLLLAAFIASMIYIFRQRNVVKKESLQAYDHSSGTSNPLFDLEKVQQETSSTEKDIKS